jgi:protein-L-isoaspartate(D-aspartate) O-methyltransferase
MTNNSFTTDRKTMVDCQLRPSKVTNQNVLEAFSTTPREEFVSKQQRAVAYIDEDLPLPGGRCLMEPMVFARLVQSLEVQIEHNVLVVGAATGYGTAIIASLAGSVIGIEARANLVEKAQDVLVSIGIDNAVIVKARLVDGYPDEGPYDRILIEGGVDSLPDNLLEQLSPKGILAAVYRKSNSPVGVASLWTRSGKKFVRTPIFDACVPNLDEFTGKPEFSF